MRRGDVSANTEAQNNPSAHAGGLVGELSQGSVTASYARGAVSSSVDAAVTSGINASGLAGGLVGDMGSSANITARLLHRRGYVNRRRYAGGRRPGGRRFRDCRQLLLGHRVLRQRHQRHRSGQDHQRVADAHRYGTGSAIYANWNLDFDSDGTNDDPWDFGTNIQHPALKYGSHVADDQRVKVTLSLSVSAIWERAVVSPARPELGHPHGHAGQALE